MVDNDGCGPHLFLWTAAPCAEEELNETNAADADRVAAWLSLLRRSMNAAMITASTKRSDAAISLRCVTLQ